MLTTSVNQTIAAEVALQVNTATPPSGTGDGFWSRTLLATATKNNINKNNINKLSKSVQLDANKLG